MSFEGWSGKGWRIVVTDAEVMVVQHQRSVSIGRADAFGLVVRRRLLGWSLQDDGRRVVRLRGMRKAQASALARVLRRLVVLPEVAAAEAWQASVVGLVAWGRAAQRWIPSESVDALLSMRPNRQLVDRVDAVASELSLTDDQLEAARFVGTDVVALVASTNETIMAAELASGRSFFDTIEKRPLTDEQARAVVCFDNRVQVVAAAGSGKTSVMVARAAYAVRRDFVAPERILMLAFNKAAAAELQERVVARFAAVGLDWTGLRASTFHSFGLDILGRATGEKPRVASWIDQGGDVRMVLRIVDELRDRSESFGRRWDLYRLLFASAPTDLDTHEPDGYDRATRETGYRTFAGEVVKSHGERMIANYLYLNGVNYVYERPYVFNVADATHSQYRPDFYYPEIDVWHEHWALDRDGNPPAAFVSYLQGIQWKRTVHTQHGTTLVESRWADVVFGDGLQTLQNELSSLGLRFDWNPDRPINDDWAKPMKHEDLARLVRTFMSHVKSNSWTREALDRRLGTELAHRSGYRTQLFLGLYWEIHDEWNRRLAAEGSVDFEDMLVRAAEHLEAGSIDCDYDMIMARRQPRPGPTRPWSGEGAGSVSARGGRRLAVDQPVRRRGSLGDHRLRVLVRPRTTARVDDHVSVHADNLRCRQQLRGEEPESVQQADASSVPRPGSARADHPKR